MNTDLYEKLKIIQLITRMNSKKSANQKKMLNKVNKTLAKR